MRLLGAIVFAVCLPNLGTLLASDRVSQDSAHFDIDFLELELITQSYCYLGDGRFFSLRSCRIPWICLEVDTSTFAPRDSTLHVSGRLYDCMHREDYSGSTFQTIVGTFAPHCPEDTADVNQSTSACLRSWNQVGIIHGERLELDMKVSAEDFLIIVPAESDSLLSTQLVSAAIFDIGSLLKDTE